MNRLCQFAAIAVPLIVLPSARAAEVAIPKGALEPRKLGLEQQALNLLSSVILDYGGSEPEDVDRLISHVAHSPDELYDTNRPLTLLLALKRDGRRDELNQRLLSRI